MKKKIRLDLATVLSITTGISLVKDFYKIKVAMEELLVTPLTDSGMIMERTRVANYILENYPQLEGLCVEKKAIDTWLEQQQQIFGNKFTFYSMQEQKNKVKTR